MRNLPFLLSFHPSSPTHSVLPVPPKEMVVGVLVNVWTSVCYMYTYECVCVNVCGFMSEFTCVCECTSLCFICMCEFIVCVSLYMCGFMYVGLCGGIVSLYMSLCMCAFMCVMCVCMFMCV